jgi:hypothetical protein
MLSDCLRKAWLPHDGWSAGWWSRRCPISLFEATYNCLVNMEQSTMWYVNEVCRQLVAPSTNIVLKTINRAACMSMKPSMFMEGTLNKQLSSMLVSAYHSDRCSPVLPCKVYELRATTCCEAIRAWKASVGWHLLLHSQLQSEQLRPSGMPWTKNDVDLYLRISILDHSTSQQSWTQLSIISERMIVAARSLNQLLLDREDNVARFKWSKWIIKSRGAKDPA